MLTTQRIADLGSAFDFSAIAGQAWRAARAVIGADHPARPDPLASLLPAGVPRYLQSGLPRDIARIDPDDRVLLLGAAPAALEVVLALADQGHRALVRLVSGNKVLHCVAPRVAERLAALRAVGFIEVCAGRVTGAAAYGDTVVVDVLPTGRALHVSERFDWVVNCSSAPHATSA